MAETDYLDSDLSNPKYKYDLVVGTTAKAINATMKMYLYKNASAPTEVWYGQETAGAPVVPMAPIPGVDPFSVPAGTAVPEALKSSAFVFAIKGGFGLPPGVDPLSIPDILILSEDRQKVTYQLFFNTFQVVTLEWGNRGSVAWTNFTQAPGDPILFKFLVDMNFSDTDPEAKFSDLPEETRSRLKNLNTSSMFSVKQLYLDLNNAGLQNMPTISGLPSNSPVLVTLQKDFINTYWKDIAAEGKFILGYAVKANAAPADARVSIQPTDLNFSVVPQYDDSGKKTANFSMYTFNYLMNSENRPLVMGGTFPWNWVKKGDAAKYHGGMAVRREIFANYLNDSLSPSLQDICIIPTTTYRQSEAGFRWDASYSLAYDSSPGKFAYSDSMTAGSPPGTEILKLTYTKSDYNSDKSGLISGHFGLTSNATGSVTVNANEFTVTLSADMQINFDNGDLGTASATGKAGGVDLTVTYIMAVDGSGKITVSLKGGSAKSVLQAATVDTGFMAGLDGVSDLVSKLTASYNSMAGRLDNFATEVQSFLNSTGNRWVFPGGQTFTFKDASFSKYQDLVCHLTYADPN